jgi:hypothetical protein
MAFFEKKVHKVKDEKEDGKKRILCMIPLSKYKHFTFPTFHWNGSRSLPIVPCSAFVVGHDSVCLGRSFLPFFAGHSFLLQSIVCSACPS